MSRLPGRKENKAKFKAELPPKEPTPSSEVEEDLEDQLFESTSEKSEEEPPVRKRGRPRKSVKRSPKRNSRRGPVEMTVSSPRRSSPRKRSIAQVDSGDADSNLSNLKTGGVSRSAKKQRSRRVSRPQLESEGSELEVAEEVALVQTDAMSDAETPLTPEQNRTAEEEHVASTSGSRKKQHDPLFFPSDSDHSSLFGSPRLKNPALGTHKPIDTPMQDVQPSLTESPSKDASASPGASRKMPAHRLRAANPKVRLIDDPFTNGGLDKVAAAADERAVSAKTVSNNAIPSSSTASTSRRSITQAGLNKSHNTYPQRDASLMVFKKGELVTLPRTARKVADGGEESSEPPLFADLDNSLADLDIFDITKFAEEYAVTRAPELPSASLLLEIAGYNPDEAAQLEDYDEDAHGEDDPDHLPQPPTEEYVSKVVMDGRSAYLPSSRSAMIQKSPVSMSPRNISFGVPGAGAWRFSNIFGPLYVRVSRICESFYDGFSLRSSAHNVSSLSPTQATAPTYALTDAFLL